MVFNNIIYNDLISNLSKVIELNRMMTIASGMYSHSNI